MSPGFAGPAQRGVGMAMIAVVLYLTIVVATTPSLRPVDAIAVSVSINWWLIAGIAAGTGVQAFLVAYARRAGCPIRHGSSVSGAAGALSGLSSFMSFLSLIPIGCCGTWVYVLSFLPGLFGAGATGFLIDDGFEIEILGLLLVAISVAYTYVSVRKRLGSSKVSGSNHSNGKRQGPSRLVTLALFGIVILGSATLLSQYEPGAHPRLFEGAFAMYSGTAMLSGLGPVNTTRAFMVLGSNATSVRMSITSSLGGVKIQTVSWEPYSPHLRLHLTTESFTREYYATMVNVRRGERNLIAEEYTQGNLTTTYYYASNQVAFPIEILSHGGLAIHLLLVSTNLPGQT